MGKCTLALFDFMLIYRKNIGIVFSIAYVLTICLGKDEFHQAFVQILQTLTIFVYIMCTCMYALLTHEEYTDNL